MRKLMLLGVAISCTPNKVSFETLEQARLQARENAEFNAKEYRSKNPEFASHAITGASDSTQNESCPQGDGWATLELKNVGTSSFLKLKCSTVSNAIGCVDNDEFKAKPYATEDGQCNASLPFPLPKIQK
jgi:hypothetical protein